MVSVSFEAICLLEQTHPRQVWLPQGGSLRWHASSAGNAGYVLLAIRICAGSDRIRSSAVALRPVRTARCTVLSVTLRLKGRDGDHGQSPLKQRTH